MKRCVYVCSACRRTAGHGPECDPDKRDRIKIPAGDGARRQHRRHMRAGNLARSE